MDPYLETPRLWPAVHNRLIVAIADALVEQLSANYRVEIEKRTYVCTDEDSLLVGIPDVAVMTRQHPAPQTTHKTVSFAVQPEQVTVPNVLEVHERYLEVRDIATGTVVTVIELLSPKNKRPGEGRVAYERKRNQILASTTHLVEIDLLRGGTPFPINSPHLNDYRMLVSRSTQRPFADLYAFSLRQTIPPVPIPLIGGETEPILELQPLLNRVYEKGRYHLVIDYTQPPQPAFSPGDRQWANHLLSIQPA
jgi:hypothetical protein